ncbi:hypothetical protein RhiirC2_775247 [Rhizophagus irregularis]|uniref:Uncharacterized protein n=1 Tax=Rhizophagus irregularis TaxID=588596 RepID=A0A2N1NJM4_9GLOM|nr:hypothetical protein RhiirC2_775247 [Rhizophagus irregularis]
MDMDKATKHESSRIQYHPASPSWTFRMLVTGISGSGKTNILGNLFLGDKAEYIYEANMAFVRYMYGIISKDPKAPYYENIQFSYISPEKIPSVRTFSPERSTVIVFEDNIYVMQKYHKAPIFIRENASHLVVFNSGSSHEDISKIIRRYTDDVKNASMVINSYLRRGEFIVFDLTRLEDDPLAIRLRFDTPLNLQKEIEARQKRKDKSTLANE